MTDKKEDINDRVSWDDYFLNILDSISLRATCDRGRNSCIIVKDNHILSTGYVGSPPGMPHCSDVGHLMTKFIDENGVESTHCSRTTHSEMNAVANAAKFGVSINRATLYTKLEPCFFCAGIISQAGIKRVVCKKRYQKAEKTRELFDKTNIELVVIEDEIEKY